MYGYNYTHLFPLTSCLSCMFITINIAVFTINDRASLLIEDMNYVKTPYIAHCNNDMRFRSSEITPNPLGIDYITYSSFKAGRPCTRHCTKEWRFGGGGSE